MAARHAFGQLIIFTILLVLQKSFHLNKTSCTKINTACVEQLWKFHVGRAVSIIEYEVPNIRRSLATSNTSTISNTKRGEMLVKYFRLALLAEINIGACLLLCGDIECNPGPDSTDFNTFNLPAKGLRFGHWNINYLNTTKFEEIKLHMLAPNGEKRLDVLVLTETFFNNCTPVELYYISGFDLLRRDRKASKSGGGILMYVNNELNAKRRTDLEESDLEVLWLQVCPFKSKRKLLMAAIYRPPGVKAEADKKFADNIERVHMMNLETILIGDFNIDSLNGAHKKHRLVKALVDAKFVQLVGSITRPVSKSCLDHIWSNKPDRIVGITCPNIGISDHLPVLGVRFYKHCPANVTKSHRYITYRNFKNFDEN